MFFWKKNRPPQGKTVMAFGTFDHLHAGHENFLQQARANGDFLLVVVARDQTVRSVKGQAPDHNERQRLKNLQKTGWADKVVLGNHEDKHKIILQYRPAVIALGYDQFVFTQTLQKTLIDSGLDSEIIRTEAYHPQTYKSSLIRRALQQEKQNQTAPITLAEQTRHTA